ncbi:MAG: alanine racemase [Verrucomicrobiia bacterium]
MIPQSYYRCWVEVDLDALRQNVAAIRRRLQPGTKLMAVVKADAYGHGLAQVAGVLMQCGVDAFAVANLTEALLLRHIGGSGWPILLFGASLPFEVGKIVEQNITPTISTLEEARLFEDEAARQNKNLPVQVEVDTGMGRVGFWHEEAVCQIQEVAALHHLKVEALYTHFPSADEDLKETKRELDAFLRVVGQLRQAGVVIPLLHTANSAALLNVPEAILDMVRPGLLLYGIRPAENGRDGPLGRPQSANDGAPSGRALPRDDEFRPVLSFKARVAFVKNVGAGRAISYGQAFVAQRPMKIATLAAGYGDGFSRTLSNAAEVLIGGRRCRVVGRVTMDQIMVDVTALAEVNSGDEVVFIGRQACPDQVGGEAEISASEVAAWAGTIAWEILCGITKTARVPRVYHGVSAA